MILEGEFDVFHWGWYVEPDPDSILSRLHLRRSGAAPPTRGTATRSTTRCTKPQNAEIDDDEADRDDQADAGDHLPGLALPRDSRTRRTARPSAPTGSRASSRSPTPAASCWCSTARYNYTLLRPADEAGDCDGIDVRDRRLAPRRRGDRRRRRQQRAADRRWRRARAAGGRWRGRRDAPTVDGGRAGVTTVTTLAASGSRRPRSEPPVRRRSYGRYVLGKVLGALGSLFFVLVVNFFLFRVLPGDPARTLTRGRVVSTGAARRVPRSSTGSTRPLPQQFLTFLKNTLHGRPGRLASATTCRSPS